MRSKAVKRSDAVKQRVPSLARRAGGAAVEEDSAAAR